MFTTGYYNINGLCARVIDHILFLLLKLQLFVMLSRWSLELKLKTQVLGSGRVLLLAYDEHNREVLKVVMQTALDQSSVAIEQFFISHNYRNSSRASGGFHSIDQGSNLDDLTSDGQSMTISPPGGFFLSSKDDGSMAKSGPQDFVSLYHGTESQN